MTRWFLWFIRSVITLHSLFSWKFKNIFCRILILLQIKQEPANYLVMYDLISTTNCSEVLLRANEKCRLKEATTDFKWLLLLIYFFTKSSTHVFLGQKASADILHGLRQKLSKIFVIKKLLLEQWSTLKPIQTVQNLTIFALWKKSQWVPNIINLNLRLISK